MKFNFTRLSLFALISMVSASIAIAAPVCPKPGPPSQPTNSIVPIYVNSNGSSNGFVCDLGGLEFSDFTTSSAEVATSDIGVIPGFQPPPAAPGANPGFTFTGPFSVGANVSQDNFVSFTVTALTGLITDVHIALDNSFVTGTGSVSYTEQVCSSPINCALFVTNPTSGSLISDLVLTTPQKSITITKDVTLNGGSNGTAFMSAFSNYYSHTSEVPEPKAVSALLGLGFFGIMAFMKRRQAARS